MEGERSALHVRQLVKEIAKIVEETFPKSIVLQVNLATDVPLIRGDQTQIHQVLLNLCVNARDAMPRGGTLSISLDNYLIDETYARIHPGVHPGKYVLLSVADTGTEFPPKSSRASSNRSSRPKNAERERDSDSRPSTASSKATAVSSTL